MYVFKSTGGNDICIYIYNTLYYNENNIITIKIKHSGNMKKIVL